MKLFIVVFNLVDLQLGSFLFGLKSPAGFLGIRSTGSLDEKAIAFERTVYDEA